MNTTIEYTTDVQTTVVPSVGFEGTTVVSEPIEGGEVVARLDAIGSMFGVLLGVIVLLYVFSGRR